MVSIKSPPVLNGQSKTNNDSEDDEDQSSLNDGSSDNNSSTSDDSDSAVNDEFEESKGNTAWANTFAKVLRQSKPKNKKYLVLSKAKKLHEKTDVKRSAKMGFEIDDGEGGTVLEANDNEMETVKEEKPDTIELDKKIKLNKTRNELLMLRQKPSAMDKERERTFKKIATKGVVQLFNAVRTQQKDLKRKLDHAGPLDHKRDAVLNNINKKRFLDVLMGGKNAQSQSVDNPVKDDDDDDDEGANFNNNYDDDDDEDMPQKPSEWSVLRNDFMTNKKMSNWDKEDTDDDNNINSDDDDDDDVEHF